MQLGIATVADRSIADGLVVEDWIRPAYQTLMPPLMDFYREGGRDMADTDLLMAIDARFGEQLSREICPLIGFHEGGCVLIALLLARETDRRKCDRRK